MNKRNKAIAASVVIAMALIGRCSTPVDVANGGASGTDVGICMVHGEVTDSLGRPVSGSVVRLRPFDYLVGRDDSAAVKRTTVSGSDGRFVLDSVPAGHYAVECVSGDSSGQVLTFNVDTVDSAAFLPTAVIMPLSTVVGTVPGPLPAGEGDRSVQVVGLERSAPIDSAGNFRLMVPPGWCRLNLHGVDADRPDYDTLILIKPGRNEILKTPHHPMLCENLSCELAIVREVLDSNGLTALAPESVVVVENNRVVGLRLRARGIRILPDPIGKLQRLRVLDIGENELRELPRTIEFLRTLREIYADHNQLWTLTPSIGKLDSLRTLDGSYNMLQSLPETIVFLEAEVVNFSGNMLCNLGEATRKWMDARDPGWRERQECR